MTDTYKYPQPFQTISFEWKSFAMLFAMVREDEGHQLYKDHGDRLSFLSP